MRVNMDYIDNLIENCMKAKKANPVKEYVINDNDLSILKGVKKGIYVIREIGGNSNDTFTSYSAYKNKKERACAKLNAPSNIMYVGSSTTGLSKRLSQHIGDGPAKTYALHLKHWFSGNYEITVREYDVTLEVLQIIEDALSDQLKPAFGKKGGNNK
jgi:hypothetical protein